MKKNPRTILYLILMALCITGAITGSFFDLQISEKLYIGDNLPAKLISLFTVFVFCGSCFFFLGVLFRQLWERYLKVTRRVITAAIFTYLFCSTAALCGAKIINDPLFAGKLTEIQGTLWGSLITGSIIYIAFFMLGIIINGKKADPDITLPANERPIGGLGIFMVKKTMDDVNYEYADGKNILRLKKNI